MSVATSHRCLAVLKGSLAVIAAVLFVACASVQVTPSSDPTTPAGTVRHRPGRLSRAELASQRGRSLGEAIRAIDNGLLMNRGEGIEVWIDGASYTVDVLQRLPANDVEEVVRLSAAEARQMFGDRASGAGLVITTRRR